MTLKDKIRLLLDRDIYGEWSRGYFAAVREILEMIKEDKNVV